MGSLQCLHILDLLAEFKAGGKKSREGNGWNMSGAIITGARERTEEGKEGEPPHVRSLPTFQPWLRLCNVLPLLCPAKLMLFLYLAS